MSHKPSKAAEERNTPSQIPTSSTRAKLENATTRKRSDTKRGNHPPAIHLSLKTSSAALSNPYDGLDLGYDTPQTSSGKTSSSKTKTMSPVPLSSPSTTSPSTGRSAGFSSSSYSSRKPSSPLISSPDRTSILHDDVVSSSLPVTLSPLSAEVSTDLVAPLPSPHSPVSSSRRPSYADKSLSPYGHGHGHSQPSLVSSRSNNNLRFPATRMPSDPASRKSSITSVERDAGLHLDMKRLLSKPSAPSHSGSSIASDSELPRSPRVPTSMSRQPSSQRIAAAGPAPKERMAMARRATDEGATTQALRKSASKSSLYTSTPAQKPRNVLRRKVSALSNPATPTAQTFQQSSPHSSLTVSQSSSKSAIRIPDSMRPGAPRRTISTTAEPASLASLRRQSPPPPDLTPAGAVAHAYKQQEQRREELAEISGWNEQMGRGRPNMSPRDHSRDSRGTYADEDEEGSGTFYTVFGGMAGRVVAVGSAEDSFWDIGYDSRFSADDKVRNTPSRANSASVSGVRSLGRKVSGRFKRSGSGTAARDHYSTLKHIDEPFDGRPPSRSASLSRPLGPSMDEYVDVRTQISVGTSLPSSQNGTPERKEKEKDPKGLRTMRSLIGKDHSTEKGGDDSPGAPGSKLWKLMKRISTGALRDKYQDSTPPPPVPALPDDYKNMTAASRMTFDIRKDRDDSSETGISRFMHSRTSMSAVRPATAPQRSSPRTEHSSSRPSTGPRQSTTTRSSSPMSSEVASSRFFHKSHSAHSSISSYGEELPPLPNSSATNVGQHIMNPGELYSKLSKDSDETSVRKPRQRSKSATQGEDAPRPTSDVRPSLPPPRRSNTAGGKPAHDGDSDPPSPLIPTFETGDPMNNFAALTGSRYSLPMSEFGVLMNDGTLGRPRKSSRKKPPPFDLASPVESALGSPSSATPRTPRSPKVPSINVDVRSLDRKSIAGSSLHSTIHDTSHSASPSSSSTAQFHSPLRFREMDSPRVRLSEREKAAKWDDLLMRSEQAGGTLHLGDTGLMSDNIRFSDYSGSDS